MFRAEDGAQTRDPQLGRLMLYQLSYFRIRWWVQMDSNHRRQEPTDLQSVPFGHSGMHPSFPFCDAKLEQIFLKHKLILVKNLSDLPFFKERKTMLLILNRNLVEYETKFLRLFV